MPATGRAIVFLSDFGYRSGLDGADAIQIDAISGSGWLLVIRGNPANAAEGLGSVSSGDPIWLTAARD